MFLTRSEYDRGVNTFSPEGRLFQVEYAIEAIKLGSTAIGIQTSSAVILAVEKRVTSTLMEPDSIEKILEIDSHIGCAMSGLIADATTMVEHARVEAQGSRDGRAGRSAQCGHVRWRLIGEAFAACAGMPNLRNKQAKSRLTPCLLTYLPRRIQNHMFTYNEKIKVESVTQSVCDLSLRFGEGAHGEKATMVRSCFHQGCGVVHDKSAVPAVWCCALDCRYRRERSAAVREMRLLNSCGFRIAIAALWPSYSSFLFHADPSGTFTRLEAKAIGAGSEGAQSELQEEEHKVTIFYFVLIPNSDAVCNPLLGTHTGGGRDTGAKDT
ncbi:MAG: hypothetical protein BJ554DRAFT_2767 [Olpidium bornovanus]|uniref:Proteasome alpha-type subunits domain-containing protein n=1 Tax=Olpidium bornovanus TaxID=278681 RepID=A0A8H8DGP3_9FUNG|nr:MAG: hypothetical protein BJ554DRAFT_2767 [Olpidium bornovanus]